METEKVGSPASVNVTGDRVRLFALAAITVALIGLCVLLAIPFLPAITWGAVLAIFAWPMHRWIASRIPWPGVAAGVTSTIVAIAILAAGMFVVYSLGREAGAAAAQVNNGSPEAGIHDRLIEMLGIGPVVAWMDRVGLDIESEMRKIVESYAQTLTGLAQGSLAAIVQFLLAVFILYYLLRDRAAFLRGLRSLLPLSNTDSDRVFADAADSVHAILYATFITSLFNAVGGGLMFWWLGLPAPVLWAVIMFVLSLLPIVGAGLVWLPAASHLALIGHWWQAIALLVWGLTTSVLSEVLYARLAGARMRLHTVPVMIAFLGGLAVFGMSGVVLGPAIVAVTLAILQIWKRRVTGAAPAADTATSNR